MIASIRKTLQASLPLVLVLAALSACNTVETSTEPDIINELGVSDSSTDAIAVDGSSTVYPITDAAAEVFHQENPDAQITVEFSGTTAGFRRFCAGETEISNASRPISTAEIEACREGGVRYIELPIAFDALTVVVNPQNTWAQDLTVSELQRIWEPVAQGRITNWNQIRPEFPDRPLTLYGPGGDSGTYDYFAEVITDGSDTRSDYTASEDDDELVQGVANDPNALGFFGFSYYENNQDRLKAIAIIDDSQGQDQPAVLPSRETVENAQYQPLSRPLFIYINGQASQRNEYLRDFVEFYMTNGQEIVKSVDYIPLPQDAYDIGLVHVFNGEYGTAYEGSPQPYLTIREVLQKKQAL